MDDANHEIGSGSGRDQCSLQKFTRIITVTKKKKGKKYFFIPDARSSIVGPYKEADESKSQESVNGWKRKS